MLAKTGVISRLKYEKPLRVQSYDPGGTTGFVEMLFSFDEPVKLLRHDEFNTWTKLDQLMIKDEDTSLIVVYETFHVLTLSANPIPLEVIGVLKYLARQRNIITVPQTPDTRLFAKRRFPMQVKDFNSHTESALLHCLSYAYNKLSINHVPVFNRIPK